MTDEPAPQTASSIAVFSNPRVRAGIMQGLLVLVLAWLTYIVYQNTSANLAKLNKGFGFDFLKQTSGFDLLQSLVPYNSSSSYQQAIIAGLLNTLLVAAFGIVFATVVGFVAGVMRLSKNWLVSSVATVYIETVRNIPLLLQMFIWYALVLKPLPEPKQAYQWFSSIFISNKGVFLPAPQFGSGALLALIMLGIAVVAALLLRRWAKRRQERSGQQFPHFAIGATLVLAAPVAGMVLAGWPLTFDYPVLGTGMIKNFKGGFTIYPEFLALLTALSIYTGAFIAEIVRAGVLAVSHGQTEASQALGLRPGHALRLVVVPQALRVIIPPLTSQYLNLIKNSSLAVAIGYPDLVYAGGTVMNQSGRAIEVVLIWMVIYLGLSLLTSLFMNWYNARMKLVER